MTIFVEGNGKKPKIEKLTAAAKARGEVPPHLHGQRTGRITHKQRPSAPVFDASRSGRAHGAGPTTR